MLVTWLLLLCLMDFCHPTSSVASRQQLRSASRRLLVISHCPLSATTARQAFSVVGLLVWNSLLDYLRLAEIHLDNILKRVCSLHTSAYSTLELSHVCTI